MKKIKKGDEVVIIAGRSKNGTGTIKSVHGDRVIVTGQQMVTKNVKPNPMTEESGGQIKEEASIHISNVMLLEDGKPVRVGFKEQDGKKVRYSKKTGATI